jgi:NADH:ubiquinone oxidoreductase subunit 4 (subunit M)
VLSGFSHLLLPLGGYALLRPVVGEIAPSSSKDTQIAAAVSITSLAALSLDVLWLAYDQTESEVRFESRARWIPHIALTTHSASLGWQF